MPGKRAKRMKRTNSQSEIESEQEKSNSDLRFKSPSIKEQKVMGGFNLLSLQKVQEEAKTIESSQHSSPKFHSAPRKISIEQVEQRTKSIEPPLRKQVCIPVGPLTFADWVHYKSKCEQMTEFLKNGSTKQTIIPWIQDNNRLNYGLQVNCQLLAEIDSDHFWEVIIYQMMSDVLKFSQSLDNQKMSFLPQKGGSKKLQIRRGDCYIILSQMFLGLIPPQYHLSKGNLYCTFSPYMYRQHHQNKSISKNQLTESDKVRLNKLKAVISYFSYMSVDQFHVAFNKQSIILQIVSYKMKQNFYMNPKNNDKNLIGTCQFQEDFGQIGDQVFTQIQVRNSDYLSGQDKFNQGKSPLQKNKIWGFFEISHFLNKTKIEQQELNSQLLEFFLSHPEAFIVKLLFPGFSNNNQLISIRNLRRWSLCKFTKEKILENIVRTPPQYLKKLQNVSRLILLKSEKNDQLKVETYAYNSLKLKIEKYINAVRASIKGYKEKQIFMNLNSINYQDFYLNFMALWIAISIVTKSKCKFVFELQDMDKSTKLNIVKIHQYFNEKDIADSLSIIRGYELIFQEKSKFFSSPKDLSFLNYLKRHAF